METKEDEMEHSKPDSNKEDDASQIVIVDLENADDNNVTKEESIDFNNTGFEGSESNENDNLPVSNPENTTKKQDCGDVDTSKINLDSLIKDLDKPNTRASSEIDNNASLEIICVDSDSESENIHSDENVSNVQESLSKKESCISGVILKEETAELKSTVTNDESSDSSISETIPANTENKNSHSKEIEKKKIETVSMQINKGHGLTKPDLMIHIPMGSFDLSQESGISSYDIDSPGKEIKAFVSDDQVNKIDDITDCSIIENNSQNVESDNEQTMDTDRPDIECVQTDKSDSNVLTNNESLIDVDKSKITEEKDSELSEKSDSNTFNNKQNVEINLADFEDDKSNPKMDENKLENDEKNSRGESSCKKTHEKAFIQRVNVINIERLMSQKDVTTGTSEANIQDINVDTLNDDNISNEDGVIDSNVCHDSAMENEEREKCSNLIEPSNDSMNKAEIDTHISDVNMENLRKDQNQPSTSYSMEQDEEMEVEDSLGLLAESSRVMEDDEDQDQEDDEDGSPDDDDGDFDPDEERNIATVDHSEDSSTHQSESEVTKDQQSFMEMAEDTKVDEIDIVINEVDTGKEAMDVDFNELVAESQDMTSNNVDADTDITIEEAPIKTSSVEQNENTTSTDNMADIETTKLSDESNDQRESKSDDQPADFQEKEGRTTPTATLNAETEKPSPSNARKLCIAKNQLVVNFVDLEETSSEDDESNKTVVELSSPKQTQSNDNVTSLHIPMEIEIMSTSGGATSEIVTRQGEVVISGVPKPRTLAKTARLNTSEVTIKTANTNPPIVIPETKIQDKKLTDKPMEQRMSLEVFNVDSDEEENKMEDVTEEKTKKAKETWKCINSECKSSATEYMDADSTAVLFFDASRKKRQMVCSECADMVHVKKRALVEDFKGMKPLLDLDPGKLSQELVEISDSDSDEEAGDDDLSVEMVGLESGQFLEDNLMEMLNETWAKYDMDTRLKESHDALLADIEIVEQECKNIDAMFHKCQVNTDKMRNDLYATFEPKIKQLQAIVIFDTPLTKYTNPEYMEQRVYNTLNDISSKKTYSSTENTPSSDAPSQDQKKQKENKEEDDNMEVSVVELSKESAPADLPAPGELYRPPLKAGDAVYARRTAFGSWMPAHITEIQTTTTDNEFTSCRVRFDGAKNATKTLLARYIAYNVPAAVRMTIGTRLIALFKDPNSAVTGKVYYSGVVAEMPNPVNNYRYLVFFDDGYAQYVSHRDTRLVCECSLHVWDEVHPYSRQFVRDYLLAYPERPMVRLHKGQNIKTEWNGKWWISRVLSVDASLVQVYFEGDDRTEWIYRGSTRLAPLFLELQAAERHRNRPNMPRSNKAQPRSNMPYVEYTRPDEQKQNDAQTPQQNTEEIRRQRAVAKKSTGGLPPPPAPIGVQEAVTSRVVYYSPKNAVKPHDMVPHNCGPSCKRTDVLTLRELRTYNPLTKPLLSGWERQIVKYKNNREVMYRAPCGRRIRNMPELHRYLRATCSDMPVDLFDFEPSTHCLAEFVLNRCRVSKKDLSHGKENVPVPCVNYYSDTLPDFCSYNTERTPTAGVPLNLDPEFLCGCDCTDDCQDKTKCACWKMTLQGARTINQTGPNVGYVYKRLPEPLPTGIYECNSRCKCKHTCLNRVAQFPLQLKLQVFKTSNRGWGIRALNDVPKGAFLCVYAGNLLTDATANLDGLNEGDEYLAELDYIEVVEQMKEGYEEDIPDADKEQDKSEGKKEESDEEEPSSSEEEATSATADKDDDDFRPAYDVEYSAVFKKTLRKREKRNKNKKDENERKEREDKDKGGKEDADCITISDDEEAIREPSRFAAESRMSGNDFVSKFRSLRSYFGKDEACYIMDAKVQGNIGRYLNHSCCPNVFVQNVFVDTHDPRFPWVAFFALSYIKAGTELTWNYNYDVGSVPGKVLYCLCRAPNCRGRLL